MAAQPAAAQTLPGRAELRPAGIRLTVEEPAVARAARSAQAAPAPASALQVTQDCVPATISVRQSTTCTVTVTNTGSADTTFAADTVSSINLPMTGATNASLTTPFTARGPRAALTGARPGGPVSVAPDPGNVFGYLPLTAFGGNTVIPLGDEDIFNLDVPGFVFNGATHTRLGITSNGYAVAGGGDAADVARSGAIPDVVRPNSVLAPFWTDLDGTGVTGVLANVLTDGVNSWIVVEWQANVAATNSMRVFQVWLGINGVQDVQYAYRFDTIAAGGALVVGAENADGTAGARVPEGVLPTADLRVTSAEAVPGGTASYTVTMKGLIRGPGQMLTVVRSPAASRPITVVTPLTVQR